MRCGLRLMPCSKRISCLLAPQLLAGTRTGPHPGAHFHAGRTASNSSSGLHQRILLAPICQVGWLIPRLRVWRAWFANPATTTHGMLGRLGPGPASLSCPLLLLDSLCLAFTWEFPCGLQGQSPCSNLHRVWWECLCGHLLQACFSAQPPRTPHARPAAIRMRVPTL